MTPTGDKLDILILCDYTYIHDWMAFSAWYSIQKNLPDANCIIACSRGTPDLQLFTWARRLQVKFFQFTENPIEVAEERGFLLENRLVFGKPSFVAVREYLGSDIAIAKSDARSTFVDYSGGCGKFIIEDWINKFDIPFEKALHRFGTNDLTLNESLVFKMWEKMYQTFSLVRTN